MQIKDVCIRTNLSKKTIRYYEEEGLIHPEKEYRDGRYDRTYSEKDIYELQIIASLRRAWFTIDEIRTMQQQPEKIAEILPRYVQWLQVQQQALRGLISAAEQLRPERITSVEQLYRLLSTEADLLPLPAGDLEPHFKYMDELEPPPEEPELQEQADDPYGHLELTQKASLHHLKENFEASQSLCTGQDKEKTALTGCLTAILEITVVVLLVISALCPSVALQLLAIAMGVLVVAFLLKWSGRRHSNQTEGW
ncbi:MAG: MerR family transcriptional regulator [Oscillospiraceae bacterium]|nr:MerR family transcriptional regulator [Oscillospiraceae bacterium]